MPFLLHFHYVEGQNIKISVIGLHRAQIRKCKLLRQRHKGLVALFFASLNVGLSERDYLRFVRTYFKGVWVRDVIQN